MRAFVDSLKGQRCLNSLSLTNRLFSHCAVYVAGALKDMPMLQSLDFSRNVLNIYDVSVLAHAMLQLPRLKEVDFSDIHLSKEDRGVVTGTLSLCFGLKVMKLGKQ